MLYHAYHEIVNLSRWPYNEELSAFNVVGTVCESGDTLGTLLGNHARSGMSSVVQALIACYPQVVPLGTLSSSPTQALTVVP